MDLLPPPLSTIHQCWDLVKGSRRQLYRWWWRRRRSRRFFLPFISSVHPLFANMSISDFPLNVAIFLLRSACRRRRREFLRKTTLGNLPVFILYAIPLAPDLRHHWHPERTSGTFLMISPAAVRSLIYVCVCVHCLTHTHARVRSHKRKYLRARYAEDNRTENESAEIIIVKNSRR